jgi:hypothetical protein
MGRIGIGVGVAWLVFGVFGASADAQWPGVVLDFEGRGHRPAQNATVSLVENRVTLHDTRVFEAAAESAGADLETAEGIGATARAEEVSLVITGRMMRRNRVLVRFLDEDGEELSSAEVAKPRNQGSRQRFNREVTAALDQALAILDERAAAERDAQMAAETNEVAHIDDETPGDEDEEGGSARGGYPLIRGLIGIDGRSRNASVNLQNGLRRTYSAFFPQLTLAIETHPFDADTDVLSGFFAAFDFAIAVGLGSNEELSSGMVVPIDTTAYRLGIHAGYLFDLDVLELGATLGFVYDAFELGPNNTMPTAAYPSIRVGGVGRIPLLDEGLLGAFVEAGIRIVMGDGELTPTFGAGSATFGFDVTGGLMGALDFGLTYGVRVGYVGYAIGFNGDSRATVDTADNGYDGGVYFGAQAGWQL